MGSNSRKKRGRLPKVDVREGRIEVLSKLYTDFMSISTGNKKAMLEYLDIEKLWRKKDKRTYKKLCRDISDFCNLVELYERGIKADENTLFRSNLGKDRKIKELIAHKLCELLTKASFNGIAFGPGSSVLSCAQVLAEEDQLPNVVVTNNLSIYEALKGYQIRDLILTGGQYKADIHACVGRGAVEGFRNAHCEVSVMGVSAINVAGELLVKYPDEIDVLKQMLWNTSEKIFIVASIQKFVSRDTFVVARVQEIIEEINNIEICFISNHYEDLEEEKRPQVKEVADMLVKIGDGKRVKIIWVRD